MPPIDVQAPLVSLPSIFGTSVDTIPAKVPYLGTSEESYQQWKTELEREPGFKIGVAWQGNPVNTRDHFRSFPLEHLSAIASMPGVRLYSLQAGPGREQLSALAGRWPLVDLGDRLGDFHNTAAIIRNLDLVITCDSAPAHLAGALGIPVWVALCFAADWRWLLDRNDSPWYPTMRLFRQTRHRDWEGVFRTIQVELDRLLQSATRTRP